MRLINQLAWECLDCGNYFKWKDVCYVVDDIGRECCICIACDTNEYLGEKEW